MFPLLCVVDADIPSHCLEHGFLRYVVQMSVALGYGRQVNCLDVFENPVGFVNDALGIPSIDITVHIILQKL